MELKRLIMKTVKYFFVLLIVPYGIETIVVTISGFFKFLLIVPYGIETTYARAVPVAALVLLIVPYGIETTV